MDKYSLVAVNTPFNDSLLTYKIEDGQKPEVGEMWNVPLGKRKTLGCIIGFSSEFSDEQVDEKDLKSLDGKIREFEKFDNEYLEFIKWISNYYHYPLGMLLADILPSPLKRPRKLNSFVSENTMELTLNEYQKPIFDNISKDLDKFNRSLIYGVTGSGKTVIYTKLISEVVKKGKSALFILPEINLTSQFVDFLTNHISCPLYCYNSSLSKSDRYGLWKLLEEDDGPKIIMAVRSGIFLPIKNLGLIIVDEEHDHSFKQEDRCCYNARDLAMKLAQIKNISVVLGSATPMIESLYRFEEADSVYKLDQRHGNQSLPEIEIVSELNKGTDQEVWPLVSESLNLIRESLEKKEQVIVLLNRLGYSNYMQCRACSHQFFCLNCSIPLRYFKKKNHLSCQTCDLIMPIPHECPECGNMSLQNIGYGTEKLKEVLESVFPEHNIERFDRDEITTYRKLENRLEQFRNEEIDILVGTQMISKGHNFKKVNTVLVLGIDSMLNFPDFRSSERAFQLLLQVAGRAGRFSGQGRVAIQTKSPDNHIFSFVKDHNYHDFYNYELQMRKTCHFPPFTRMVMIYLTSRFMDRVENDATILGEILRKMAENLPAVDILGPRAALVEKRANKYTYCLMLNSSAINDLHNLVTSFKSQFKPTSGTTIKVDIDPYHLA